MSRSHNNYVPVKHGEGKMSPWKKQTNKKFRRKAKQAMSREGATLPNKLREVADMWSSPMDIDKHRVWIDAPEELYRK